MDCKAHSATHFDIRQGVYGAVTLRDMPTILCLAVCE